MKRVIELASAAGMPTHVHSCGPEKELIKIFAEETDLTVIDPLDPGKDEFVGNTLCDTIVMSTEGRNLRFLSRILLRNDKQ